MEKICIFTPLCCFVKFKNCCNRLLSGFRDIILESKATELLSWTCNVCPFSVPHMHVHKVILSASCDYLQALFNSGMQER